MTDQTFIKGKDAALEETIAGMQTKLKALNIDVEEASRLNPIPNILSVHIRDKDYDLIAYDFFKNKPGHEFSDWDHDASTTDEFNYLCNIIHQLDFDIYLAGYEKLHHAKQNNWSK